jgi:DNA polymerase-3 subunit chi
VDRVDFYVLDGDDARERWKFACRIVDKAFQAEQRVLVWFDDAANMQAFDELLWTFADRAFIPHEPAAAESDWEEAPVLLSHAQPPPSPADVLINLAAAVPDVATDCARAIEIIDADPTRRQAGRTRFKRYRELGVEPQTHTIGGESAA